MENSCQSRVSEDSSEELEFEKEQKRKMARNKPCTLNSSHKPSLKNISIKSHHFADLCDSSSDDEDIENFPVVPIKKSEKTKMNLTSGTAVLHSLCIVYIHPTRIFYVKKEVKRKMIK